jgi:hypothetical protein
MRMPWRFLDRAAAAINSYRAPQWREGPISKWKCSAWSASLSGVSTTAKLLQARSATSRRNRPFESLERKSRPTDTTVPSASVKLEMSIALLIACLRHTSAVAAPASCSRRTAMICSSVNRLARIVRPFPATDSTHFWRYFRGSRQVSFAQPESRHRNRTAKTPNTVHPIPM